MEREKSTMICLGSRIRQARDRAGLTQEQLAERIGVSRTAIARYESGEIEPKLHNLAAIAEALDVSCDELLGVHHARSLPELSPEAAEALGVFIREIHRSRLYESDQNTKGR